MIKKIIWKIFIFHTQKKKKKKKNGDSFETIATCSTYFRPYSWFIDSNCGHLAIFEMGQLSYHHYITFWLQHFGLTYAMVPVFFSLGIIEKRIE